MTNMYASKGNRHTADFYPTPHNAAMDAINAIEINNAFNNQTDTIFDPGAGDGAWGKACRQRWPKAYITGLEVRPECWPKAYDEWHIGRFEDFPTRRKFKLIIGNPPYKYAEAWIGKCLQMLIPSGTLAFLLRLQFMGGKAHAQMFQNTPLNLYGFFRNLQGLIGENGKHLQ